MDLATITQEVVSTYTVSGTDTLNTIAKNLADSIIVNDPALTTNPSSVTVTIHTYTGIGYPKSIANATAPLLSALSNSNINISATYNPNSFTSIGTITAVITTPNVPVFSSNVTDAKTEIVGPIGSSLNGTTIPQREIVGDEAAAAERNDMLSNSKAQWLQDRNTTTQAFYGKK